MTREEFIKTIASYVQKHAPEYGIKVYSPIIGQACKESAFGTSFLATQANNVFGIKYKNATRVPIAIGYINVNTKEEYQVGQLSDVTAAFCKFSSLEDCVIGYLQFINISRYNNLKGVTDPKVYCDLIKEDGYATGSTYATSLYKDYVIGYNLTQYDPVPEKKEDTGRQIKIMLDAGHDGRRNQSPVYPYYFESDFAWKLQTYLATELQAYGFAVGTTRLSQAQVMDVVPRGKASKGYDLFLSLHSDACGTPSVDRVSCIYLVNHQTCEAARVSKEIAEVLAPVITQTMGVKDAPKCYSKINGSDRNGNGITTDDDYYGVLYGAHQVNTPGIILEHSFHTNMNSAVWLSMDENVRKLARAEAQAIASYFGKTTTEVKPQTPQTVDTLVYTVVKGDTLGEIAKRFGTTVAEIQALNPCILNVNKIVVGWKLTMPTSHDKGSTIVTETSTEYIVKKGDTLSKIGQMFGISYLTIALQNKIVNPSKIYPGQVLKITKG